MYFSLTCNSHKPENLHLTLAFIGEVGYREFSLVRHIFLEQPAFTEAFEAHHPTIGSFNSRNGKLIWAGIDVDDCFRDYVRNMRQQLNRHGIPVDTKEWRPHITLSRRTRGLDLAQLKRDFSHTITDFEIKQLDLFQSEFTPHGMQYTSLEQIRSEL
ncbi:MAG TPA: RNA 2',3'-cyclic phosphodiesterase [Clostridiaceae bacterium]|nr:RNA 2',3'-cyclic phosphodiesterase [Clostridiaceae bacterium]